MVLKLANPVLLSLVRGSVRFNSNILAICDLDDLFVIFFTIHEISFVISVGFSMALGFMCTGFIHKERMLFEFQNVWHLFLMCQVYERWS